MQRIVGRPPVGWPRTASEREATDEGGRPALRRFLWTN